MYPYLLHAHSTETVDTQESDQIYMLFQYPIQV